MMVEKGSSLNGLAGCNLNQMNKNKMRYLYNEQSIQ